MLDVANLDNLLKHFEYLPMAWVPRSRERQESDIRPPTILIFCYFLISQIITGEIGVSERRTKYVLKVFLAK